MKHYIYQATNAHGDLLYIGITRHDQLKKRWRTHQLNQSKWCRDGTRFAVTHEMPNREEAERLELRLILHKNPPFNKIRAFRPEITLPPPESPSLAADLESPELESPEPVVYSNPRFPA